MINRINTANNAKPVESTSKVNKNEMNNDDSESKSIKKSDKKYDSVEINKLLADNEKRISDFKQTIKKMISKQGEASNLKLFGLDLTVSVEDSKKASEAIAEGGEYSVDAVATRIMDMAKSLSGGDKSKISVLRDAVKEGFKAAGKELGSDLPDICNQTYDEIMKRFDEWEKE